VLFRSRSQVMTLALAGAKRQLGAGEGGDDLRVGKPHGAESGFDPHTAYKDLDDTNFFGYINGQILGPEEPSEWLHRAFQKAFGVVKEKRVGQDTATSAGRTLNPNEFVEEEFARTGADRLAQREDMNALLYNPEVLASYCGDASGRVVIFAFARASGIIMSRLLEAHAARGSSETSPFQRLYIVALPLPDNINSAGTSTEIEEHLKRTGETITKEQLSEQRHKDVYGTYKRILALPPVQPSGTGTSQPAIDTGGATATVHGPISPSAAGPIELGSGGGRVAVSAGAASGTSTGAPHPVLKPSSPPIELAGVEPSLPPTKRQRTKEEIAAERCCCQCKCAIL